MYNKIYTVIDHGNNTKYKFMGALSSQIKKIFDKHNRNAELSTDEKNTLKQNYGKGIVTSINDCIIVDCYIYRDDSINTIKKKIETFCDDVNNYNNLHLWGKVRKMPYNLENEYKNFILNEETNYELDVNFSTPLNKTNREQVKLELSLSLGVEYRIDSGIRIMPMDPLNYPEDLDINFKDIRVNTGSKLLDYYGEFSSDTLHFLTLNSFNLKSTLPEEVKENVARFYFPNSVRDEEEQKSYNDLIINYEEICSKYNQIITDESLKINESYRFVEEEVLKDVVVTFGLNLNKDLDLEMMFSQFNTNNDIPFVKYRDPSRNSVYKINDNSVKPKAEKVLAKDDFKNYKTYFTPFIIGYYSSEISLDTLEGWKNNKYSLKEKFIRKSRKNINLLNDLGEITFKVKYGDNYYTILLRNNGTVYFQLFDIDYKRVNISKLIDNIIVILRRHGINEIKANVSKIDNLSSSFKYLKYDVEREFLVTNTEIPIENYNLAILEKKASDMYPFCFVTYDNENTDTLLLKYIRVNENESNSNYVNFFMKLQNSSKKLGVEKFRKLWEEQSRLVFNLSTLETNNVFERVIEQVQEENVKKEGVEIYSTIAIKLKDQFEDKLVYSVSIQNVSNTNELKRIERFIQYLFYVSGLKQRSRKASASKTASPERKESSIAPVIKLQEVKTNTFADEDDLDFDEESGDEGDEFEYEYDSEDEEGEVVTIPDPEDSTPDAPEEEGEELPEQKLNLAKLSFRKYMGDMRKIKDNKLFNYTTSKLYEQYSRICGSSDMRQPIILTKAEYNNFKIKNLEAFNQTSFLEWGSNSSSINYYLCPRIWCIRDKVALTPKQLVNNSGKCPYCGGNIINLKDKVIGEDNTIIIRKGGSNNYWKTTLKKSKTYRAYLASLKEGEPNNWNLYLKETEKDAYPGLLHPKQHPNKLCMPCCNTELHKEKNFDKCKGVEINYTNYLNKEEISQKIREGEVEVTISVKDLKEGAYVDGKLIHRGDTIMVLNQFPDYKKDEDMGTDKFKLITELVGFYTITKTGTKKITKFTNLEIDLEDNMNITITSGSTNKDHIFTLKKKGKKFLFDEPEPKDEADKSYILGAEKFPIDVKDKYGFLSDNLNKLFRNSLEGLIEKGKIINSKKASLFLRKGLDQNYLYSFLSAIASLREVSINGLIRRVVENLTPDIFVSLNCGELVKLFGENPEVLFDKKLEKSFVKWCGVYSDFVLRYGDGIKRVTLEDVTPDNHKIARLIVVYFAFEYYKKYIGDLNVYKDIEYLWDLFSRKIHGVFDNGLNIVIIEDSKSRVNILCPNVDDSSMFYSLDKPTAFILKKRDENGTLFEPIVFINHERGEINDSTTVDTSALKTAEKIINMVQKSCVSLYPKNQSSYGFTKGITITEFLEKTPVDQIKSIILDDYMKGLGLVLKTGEHVFLESFAVLPNLSIVYKSNVKPIEFEKLMDLLKKEKSLSVNKYIVKGDDVVGVLTRDGNIYKVKSKKKQSEMDISKRKIIDYGVISKSMIDERIVVVNRYEKKKRQYEMFVGEVSAFFKKNYRVLAKNNFYKNLGLIIRNRLKTIVEKKEELVKIFTQILDNITEKVKVLKPFDNQLENYCVLTQSNKCKQNEKCKYTKGNKSFTIEIPEEIQINKPNCVLKIEESYYKLFVNNLVDQLLRSNIKRDLILTGKYKGFKNIIDETIVKTDEYSNVLSDIFSKTVNNYLAELPKSEIGKIKQIKNMDSLEESMVDEEEGIFSTTIGWNKKDYKDIPNIVAGECKFPFFKKVSQNGKVVHKKFMKCIPYKVDGIDAGYACPTKTGKFGVGVEWGFCPENTPAEFLSDSIKTKSNPPSRRGSRSRSPSPGVSPKSKQSEFKTSIARFFLDNNFKIVPKPMDGDCFFHSFTGGLPREFNIDSNVLRRLVVETVTDKELIEWGGIFTNLIETINSKTSSKLEKANARDAIKDFKHLEGVVSLADLKRNMMNRKIFWANDWAISTSQFILNVKVIILDVRNYDTNPENAIKCDLDARKNVTRCAFPGCGMTHEELILKQNGMLPPALDKKYTHDGDHIWNDHSETDSYNFLGFVIVEYDGSHYNLVSYNEKTFFLPGELPSNLVEKIQRYCIEPDINKSNIFSKMGEILTKKVPIERKTGSPTNKKPKSRKLVRRKKEPISYTPKKLGTWVEQPNKAVHGSFKVPGAKGSKGRDTLEEAKRICNENDGCLGITKKKKENSKYTLRTGPKISENPSEDSWIKKEKYLPSKRASPPRSSPKVNKVSSPKPKKKRTVKKNRVLVELDIEVPSGYTRLPNKALLKNLSGVQRKKDLKYAVEQARIAGDKCPGFVMGRDGKYSLRIGKDIVNSKTNEVLFIKNKFLPRESSSGSESD